MPYNKYEITKNNISDIIKKYKLYISEIYLRHKEKFTQFTLIIICINNVSIDID